MAFDTMRGPPRSSRAGQVPGFISELILFPSSDSGVFVSINTNPYPSRNPNRVNRRAGGRGGVRRDTDRVTYGRVSSIESPTPPPFALDALKQKPQALEDGIGIIRGGQVVGLRGIVGAVKPAIFRSS